MKLSTFPYVILYILSVKNFRGQHDRLSHAAPCLERFIYGCSRTVHNKHFHRAFCSNAYPEVPAVPADFSD